MSAISIYYHPGALCVLLPRAFQIQEQVETLIFRHPSLTIQRRTASNKEQQDGAHLTLSRYTPSLSLRHSPGFHRRGKRL